VSERSPNDDGHASPFIPVIFGVIVPIFGFATLLALATLYEHRIFVTD
jgi:hypothetical protein